MASDAHSDQTVVVSVLPGEVLDGRWRIDARIGQGAMGSVFRALDMAEQVPVAVKILSPEHCRKPKVLARFEREAGLMTTLRHQNIVQLYGHGRRGVLPYIAMEYLEGLTLSEVLQRLRGPLPLDETVEVLKQVASGLTFLHLHGLVHRDIKPQNVFVTTSGRIVILDLGVVRDIANPGLTRPGAMVGTPYYMSPEQILGVEDIDKRTDVYALAAVAFELLTSRPPYLGSNNFEVLFAHKNAPPPNATDLNRKVPKALSAVLVGGLSKKREERPETAAELVANLVAIVGAKTVDLAASFPFLQRDRPVPRRLSGELQPPASADESLSAKSAEPGSTRNDLLVPTKRIAPRRPEPTVSVALDLDHVDTDAMVPKPVPQAVSGQLRVVTQMRGQPVKALLVVDGMARGMTPRTVQLEPGRHSMRVERKGAKTVERVVEVKADELVTIRVEVPSA